MNNYETARKKACELFAKSDMDAVIANNGLRSDDDWIYVTYLYNEYRISKVSGVMVNCKTGLEANYTQTLSVFDLICHRGTKIISGDYAAVNSLKGGPVASGVTADFNSKSAELFDKNKDAFIASCLALGAKQIKIGDIGFEFCIFNDLKAQLKFYASDDEFPASITLLWDCNTLQFMNYETVFYVAGDILDAITLNFVSM